MPDTSKPPTKVTFSELRTARHKLANFVQPHSSSRRSKSASQEALNALLKSTLTSAGFDLNKFEAIRKQGEAEVREWAAKRKAEDDAETSAMQKTIQRTIENWRNTVVGLKNYAVPPASPFQYFLLDTATEISATSGITLASSTIAPENNSAEFQLETSASSWQEVTFGFSWQNATDKYAVINVDGYLVLNGVCQAIAEGGFFPDDRESSVSVYARLYLGESWQPAGTSPLTAASEPAFSPMPLLADGGGFDDPGQINNQNLFRGFDLQYQLLLVPPGGVVMVEVACSLSYSNSQGKANYVFVTMGRQVLCPGVLITVLS